MIASRNCNVHCVFVDPGMNALPTASYAMGIRHTGTTCNVQACASADQLKMQGVHVTRCREMFGGFRRSGTAVWAQMGSRQRNRWFSPPIKRYAVDRCTPFSHRYQNRKGGAPYGNDNTRTNTGNATQLLTRSKFKKLH